MKNTFKKKMMKIYRIVLTLLLVLTSLQVEAGKVRRVRVKTPGTLPALIGEKNKYRVREMAIEGALNGTDLRFLREMAGSDYSQQPTKGQLRSVDLSKATYARGGEAYILKDTAVTVTGGANTLPAFLFRNCKVEQVILPESMDTLGVGALEYSALREIRIPENAVLLGWTFNHCENLEHVEFPEYVTEIGQNCFRDCASLRRLQMHDVQMLFSRAFENVPALEEIVIDGTLTHVDGWFCNDCPALRRIEFSGHVVTTGGQPIASNCPQLAEIVFSGICQPTYFGSVENCPLVKSCTVTGIVVQSSDNDFLPSNFDPAAIPHGRMVRILKAAGPLFDKVRPQSKYMAWTRLNYGDIAYNLACATARKGLKAEALQMLNRAAECGYTNYDHAMKDDDLANVRGDARYDEAMQKVKDNYAKWQEEHDYPNVLRRAPAYSAQRAANAPAFTYAPVTDPDLQRVRSYFNLDSIAGTGDEFTRMKRIMYWLHDEIPHNGSGGYPSNVRHNSIDLYEACKAQGRGLNCRGLAFVLAEMYQSMGWPARAITCQPKDYLNDTDCHVIDMVWSDSLQKWVWMDPSFAAYVTDENGVLLHPGEVRRRIIENRTIILNEDANWNHKVTQTKEDYIDRYMAKNLYYISAHLHNVFNLEGPGANWTPHYTLAPEGSKAPQQSALSDEEWFWQSPAKE